MNTCFLKILWYARVCVCMCVEREETYSPAVCMKGDCAEEHNSFIFCWLSCYKAWCVSLFSAPLPFLGEVPLFVWTCRVFHAVLCKDTFSTLGSCFFSFFSTFFCNFPLPFFSWLDSTTSKVMAAGVAGLIFPLRPSVRVFFEWFTWSIIGTLTLKLEWVGWAGREK